MKEGKFFLLDIAKKTDELKRLISEHPDYPIVVMAGEDANNGAYYWMYCEDISFKVGEVLTVEVPWNEEIILSDREQFEEELEEWLYDYLVYEQNQEITEEEFQVKLKEEIAKYESYWTWVIQICATN